jgi:hypothetical protein
VSGQDVEGTEIEGPDGVITIPKSGTYSGSTGDYSFPIAAILEGIGIRSLISQL